MIRTVRRHGAHFSVTVPVNSSVRAAIGRIPEEKWTPVEYPQAIWDDQLECWVSDAEVAETGNAAFTSKPKKEQVTARLIVRRVRARNDKAAEGQDELFPAWRHHARVHRLPVAPVRRPAPRSRHRRAGHRRPERRPPRSPAGAFNANGAWLVLAAMAHNLLRAAGTRTGTRYAKARTATIGRDLITMPGRTARHGRGNLILHLPAGHHREQAWLNLRADACGPPATAA